MTMLAATAAIRRVAALAAGSPKSRYAYLLKSRSFSTDLPYHIVVGMPALSPTMESGTLAEWNVAVGDEFTAGDSLAKIETDKATIDFEAQDDGYVASLIIEAGTQDVDVGVPIMVTVEEQEDVAAFKDFEAPHPEAKPEPLPAKEPKKEPVVVEAAAPPPPPPAAPTPPPPPTPEPAAVVEQVVEEAVAAAVATAAAPTMAPAWGNLARTTSPIAKTLGAQQKEYIEMYGTTGQIPL